MAFRILTFSRIIFSLMKLAGMTFIIITFGIMKVARITFIRIPTTSYKKYLFIKLKIIRKLLSNITLSRMTLSIMTLS